MSLKLVCIRARDTSGRRVEQLPKLRRREVANANVPNFAGGKQECHSFPGLVKKSVSVVKANDRLFYHVKTYVDEVNGVLAILAGNLHRLLAL